VLKRIFGTPAILLLAAASAGAQTAAETQKILDRLDHLESENRRLSEEITELKNELATARAKTETETPNQSAVAAVPNSAGAASQVPGGEIQKPSISERLDVEETRTAELDQKKVESSQKMPVQLTGMLLFNAFSNGASSGTNLVDPVVASSTAGQHLTGATFRQSVLGLRFFGPQLPGGGKVSGSVYMDFFGGTIQPNNNLFRLRLATINLAWKNTTLTVGQDKPIIAPRDPTSLAQVAVSPLTGAGNLWQWQPQARIEQRFTLSESSEINAQAGVYESN